MWREVAVAYFKVYYSNSRLEELRKSTNQLSQVIQLPAKHFNPVAPEGGAGVNPTRPGCSVLLSNTVRLLDTARISDGADNDAAIVEAYY
jgi:hypothetical protein